ncbi:MAG: DMT family transporter [Polyangiaceae bacterium]
MLPLWAGDAMALGCALAWALAILLFRKVELEGSALNLFKNAFATLLLFATLAVTATPFDRSRAPRDWVLLAVSGVLGLAVGDTLFLTGLRRIDASVAAVADCAYSPTVVLLSALVLGEPLGVGILLGGPLIVAGLVAISWRVSAKRAAASPLASLDRVGLAFAISGVMVTAIGVVVAKPALGRSVLVEATAVRLVAGTAALVLFQVVAGRGRAALRAFVPSRAWFYLAPATFLGTYVAMILWLGGMKYGLASRAALLNQTSAVMLMGLSRIAGEQVPLRRWVGAGLAISGVFVVVALR